MTVDITVLQKNAKDLLQNVSFNEILAPSFLTTSSLPVYLKEAAKTVFVKWPVVKKRDLYESVRIIIFRFNGKQIEWALDNPHILPEFIVHQHVALCFRNKKMFFYRSF